MRIDATEKGMDQTADAADRVTRGILPAGVEESHPSPAQTERAFTPRDKEDGA